jgi:hypothetical protein
LHGNVVMMGGFRGSVLRDPVADQRLWIPLKVPTGIRKVTLALGLTDEDELKSREKIVGTKMLTHVGPLDMGKTLKSVSSSFSQHPSVCPSADAGFGADRHTLTSISHSQKLAARGPRLSIPFVPQSVVQHVHPSNSSSHNSPSSPSIANSNSQPDNLLLKPRLKVLSWGYDFRLKLQTPSRELIERLTEMKRESKERGEGIDGQGIGAVVICHSVSCLSLYRLVISADQFIRSDGRSGRPSRSKSSARSDNLSRNRFRWIAISRLRQRPRTVGPRSRVQKESRSRKSKCRLL